jgi:hypothetical protein
MSLPNFKGPCNRSGSWSPASQRCCPSSSPGKVAWDSRWTKRHCGRFSWSTSVFLASHSNDCSAFIIFIHHLRVSSGASTVHQIVADVPSGLSLTPLKKLQKLKNYQIIIIFAFLAIQLVVVQRILESLFTSSVSHNIVAYSHHII